MRNYARVGWTGLNSVKSYIDSLAPTKLVEFSTLASGVLFVVAVALLAVGLWGFFRITKP